MNNPAASPDRIPTQVYLFSTCLIDMMSPQAGVDAVELMHQAGIEVVFPPNQTCCGQPAFSSGFDDEARAVVKAQLNLFPNPWPIVVPSGSCAGMMVRQWPALLANEPALHAQALEVVSRVVEWTHFAHHVLRLNTAQAETRPVKVALHTSCSARREMNAHLPSAALLQDLPGVEVVSQARPAECCGFGGTFALRHPSISGAMVNDKLDSLRDAGAKVVVSGDCGCLLNMHHAAEARRAAGEDMPRFVHLASFLRERLGLGNAAQQITD